MFGRKSHQAIFLLVFLTMGQSILTTAKKISLDRQNGKTSLCNLIYKWYVLLLLCSRFTNMEVDRRWEINQQILAWKMVLWRQNIFFSIHTQFDFIRTKLESVGDLRFTKLVIYSVTSVVMLHSIIFYK